MDASQVFTLALLVVVANAAPLVVSLLLANRWNVPLDGSRRLRDQQPVLGPHKTIRGLLASVMATALLAYLLGFSPVVGVGFASLAMVGDISSSFIKRRFSIPSGRSMPILDQLPESLLPLWFMQPIVGGTMTEILAAVTIFTFVDLVLSWFYSSC